MWEYNQISNSDELYHYGVIEDLVIVELEHF